MRGRLLQIAAVATVMTGAQWLALSRVQAQAYEARPDPVVVPAAVSGSAGTHAEIERLRSERAQIDNYIPGFFMYAGGSAAAVMALTGAFYLVFDCEEWAVDCEARERIVETYAPIGVVAALVGIIGLVVVLNNHGRRRAIDARIRELQSGRAALRLDWRPQQRGAALALRLQL